MSNVINAKQWLLNNHVTYDKHVSWDSNSKDSTFKLIDVKYDLDDPNLLQKGEVLIETLYLSNDPAQKGWFSPTASYVPVSPLNAPAPARGLAKVIKSNSDKFKENDIISCAVGWTTHAIIKDSGFGFTKVDPSTFDKLSKFISVFGTTSITAYLACFKYSQLPKPEEAQGKVFLVTGAAGAVGSVATQIFSKVFGAKKVIAVAGGPEKVKFVESLGNGNVVGLDYRSKTYSEDFAKALGDDQIDVFVDQVGGELLDIAAEHMKVHGRIVQVGTIAGYNDPTKMYFKNYPLVVTKRLSIQGFVIIDDAAEIPQVIGGLANLIKTGKIDASNIKETVVDGSGDNFSKVPELWTGLFKGHNTGKYITRVTTDPKL